MAVAVSARAAGERKPVIVVLLVVALCLMGDSMLYIALPVYWKEAGLASLWEVGLILSINRFVRMPLAPVVGWPYSRIEIRTGIVAAVLLAAFSTLGYGIWKGLWVWLALRSLWGLSFTLLRLGAFFTVINCAGENNRGHLMGTTTACTGWGAWLECSWGGSSRRPPALNPRRSCSGRPPWRASRWF